MENKIIHNIAYSKNVVEFATVSHQYCQLIEEVGKIETVELLSKLQKILPLLYIKAALLPQSELQLDESLEKFVTELDYNTLHQKWLVALGEHDSFYEVFDPNIQFGSEMVTASITENILDIYQDVKDFILSYRLGVDEVMHDAMLECASHFKDFWGQQLVNVLRAIHMLIYSDTDLLPSKNQIGDDNSENHNDWLDKFWGTASTDE